MHICFMAPGFSRFLPDSIENNRWIQINRKEIGHKPDTSQMKKRPICIGVFSGNQIDWISQFSQFQQYLNILRCVWIGTGSFLRSELNWKCKLSTWLLKYTVRWKYCLVQASSRYLVGRWIIGWGKVGCSGNKVQLLIPSVLFSTIFSTQVQCRVI